MSNEERRQLSRLAHSAKLAHKTKQDVRIANSIQANLAAVIYEAVDTLFERMAKEHRRLALVIHRGDAWIVDPETRDYRLVVQRHPQSIIGTYDATASYSQVMDDIKELPPLAKVLR